MNTNCFEDHVLGIIILCIIASYILIAWNVYSVNNPKPAVQPSTIQIEQKNSPQTKDDVPININKSDDITPVYSESIEPSTSQNEQYLDAKEQNQIYAPVPQQYNETLDYPSNDSYEQNSTMFQQNDLEQELLNTSNDGTETELDGIGELENELF